MAVLRAGNGPDPAVVNGPAAVEPRRRQPPLASRRDWLTALAGWMLGSGTAVLPAQDGRSSVGEYAVKAAFLYNFAKFIEWPRSFLGAEHAPLQVGIIGSDPFGTVLDEILQGKTVRGRKFRIKRFRQAQEIELCHILFISLSDKRQVENVLEAVGGSPVLTVGEDSEFTHLGGVVELVLQNSKVRFEINAAAAQRAGLKISSQLLKLALQVHES